MPAPQLRCAIGLDIGGTKLAGGLLDGNGRVIERVRSPTLPGRGARAVLEDALQMAETLARRSVEMGCSARVVGISVCELVSPEGSILSAATIDWRGWPIAERFSSLAPTWVEADSRAAAYAEARCGAGQGLRSFYYVTVGTGIGGSLILGSEPFPGAAGCAGTLASGPTAILCRSCGEVQRAVLEEIASGPALVRRYNLRADNQLDSAEQVIAAIAAGDPDARWVVNTAAECLGAALGQIVNLIDPEALIVGGGLGSAPGPFWTALVPAIRAAIWSDVHRDLAIRQAACGGDSAWIGAGLRALRKLASC